MECHELKPGDKLGKTMLGRLIGAGASGRVYLGQHPVHGRVAVKVLPPEVLHGNPRAEARFLREARLAQKLSHPNLVTVHEAGVEGSYHYLVMEYVQGRSAKEWLKQEGAFSWRRALEIVTEVCRALTETEALGIVHRDIKPSNILIAKNNTVKLADLGLAKDLAAENEIEVTQVHHAVGTYQFMSPEQCRDSRKVDIRTDLFCLGATFYTLLTGETPFKGNSSLEVMTKILREEPPSPLQVAEDIPPPLLGVLWKLLRKEPEGRYGGAMELLKELARLLANRPPQATPGWGSGSTARPSSSLGKKSGSPEKNEAMEDRLWAEKLARMQKKGLSPEELFLRQRLLIWGIVFGAVFLLILLLRWLLSFWGH